jgi:Amidase
LHRTHREARPAPALLHLDRARRGSGRRPRRRRDAGRPLHGVPLAHNDMFYVVGKASTCGSKVRLDVRPTYTATVMERLAAAGAIDLGGLAMVEFALGPHGYNAHLEQCRNPWNPEHIPCGPPADRAWRWGRGRCMARWARTRVGRSAARPPSPAWSASAPRLHEARLLRLLPFLCGGPRRLALENRGAAQAVIGEKGPPLAERPLGGRPQRISCASGTPAACGRTLGKSGR